VIGVRLELGPGRVTEELQLTETNQAGENLALSTGRPVFPLPKGTLYLLSLPYVSRGF
jgi:hypothetical protein